MKPLALLATLTLALGLGSCNDGSGGDGLVDAGDTGSGACAEDLFDAGDHMIEDKESARAVAGHKHIDGNLFVWESTLDDLEELVCLETLTGQLYFRRNDDLETFVGLEALYTIGASLIVEECPLVTDLSELSTLQTASAIVIGGNEGLVSLAGLENIGSTTSVLIEENPALESLAGLDGLTEVFSTLMVTDNDALTDISALTSLVDVNASVHITGNAALPYCQVCDVLAGLEHEPATVNCWGNLADDCWVDSALSCE